MFVVCVYEIWMDGANIDCSCFLFNDYVIGFVRLGLSDIVLRCKSSWSYFGFCTFKFRCLYQSNSCRYH